MATKSLKILVIWISLFSLLIIGQVAKAAMKPTDNKQLQRAKFAQVIERINNDCPISAAMGYGYVTSVKIEDGYVTYHVSYSPEFTNVLTKFHSVEEVKDGMMMCMLCMNAQGKNQGDVVMNTLISLEYGLRLVINKSGNGYFDFKASVDDIKHLQEKYKLNPHEALYNFIQLRIEEERINLPKDLGEGMAVADYNLEGENIAIVVQIDEYLYPIDELKANMGIIKSSIIEGALSQPESHSLLDMCKISHTGLIYRMISKQSQQKLDIIISSDEIRQLVDTPSKVNIQ